MPGLIRIYSDEHVGNAIVNGLRRRGVDVLTFREADLVSASDDEHLRRAHAEGRVMLTQDEDFAQMHAEGFEHSGIIIIPPRRTIGQIIKGVFLIYEVFDSEEMMGHIEYV